MQPSLRRGVDRILNRFELAVAVGATVASAARAWPTQALSEIRNNPSRNRIGFTSRLITRCFFASPLSGRKHKAWGGAQRNPRFQTQINGEPVKRATAPKAFDHVK
jgi:hypothetical protein